MPQEKVKISIRTLANGKKVKVKAHNRTTKGRASTPVVQHQRGSKTKQEKLREKSSSGKEIESRKSELAEKKQESKKEEAKETHEKNDKGETVTHDKETGGITWTMPANANATEAAKAEHEQKVAFHKDALEKNKALLVRHTKENAAALKSGDKNLIAKSTERLEGSQDMVDRHARLLAQHTGAAAPKPQYAKPDKVATTEAVRGGSVNEPSAKKAPSVPVPAAFKANEQQKVGPATGAGASPKSAKEVPESDFSRRVREWQEKSARRGMPKTPKKKTRPGKVERVFGGNKASLKASLEKITKQFNP